MSKLDVNGNNELPILWRTTEILASSPDKSEHFVIDSPGMEVQGGWEVSVRFINRRKVFNLGERLQFSYREIADTILSLIAFSLTMVQTVEQYGRSVGIAMLTPSDVAAQQNAGPDASNNVAPLRYET